MQFSMFFSDMFWLEFNDSAGGVQDVEVDWARLRFVAEREENPDTVHGSEIWLSTSWYGRVYSTIYIYLQGFSTIPGG